MKTDKLLHLIQQKKAMRSGGALPLPKAQTGKEVYIPVNETTATPLSPPKLYNIPRTHKPTEGQEFFTTLGVGAIPYLGDAVDVYSAIKSAQKGDLAGTLINTTGAFLPYVAGQTLQEGWDKLGEYANNYWETKYKKQGGGELDPLLAEYKTIQDQVNKGLSEKSDYRKRVQDAAARAIKDKVVVENTDFVPQDVKNWKDPKTGEDAAFCISGVCYMLNQARDDYKYFSNTAALNDALAGKGNRTYEPDTKYTEVGDVLQFNKGEKGAPYHAALVTDLIDLPNNPGWKQVMTAMSPGKGPIKSSEYYLSPSGEIYNTPDENAVYKKNTSLLKKKFNDDSLNKTISRRDSLKAQIEKIQPGYFDSNPTRFDLNDPYMPVDAMTNPSAWYGKGDQSYVLGPGSTDRFAEQIYPKESKISEMLTKASDPDFKKQIMKDHNIGSKEYDAIIKTALGIYGTETKFGTDYWGKAVPEPQWLSKMIGYGTVGPFQLGRNNFSKELKQKYSNKDLHDPEKAFQAAVEFLAENTRNLRTKARAKPGDQYYMQNVGPDNYLDYLPYVYGAPGFLTGDKRTMKKYNDIVAGEHPYAERVKYFSNMFDVMPSSISKPVEIIGNRQGGGPIMNPYMPGVPMATGAVESTMGPVEMLLLPSQLPIRAATALGRGAVLAAEALNPISGFRNVYKINPWAFKPNPEAYYRMIGKEGYADALESGIIRAKPTSGVWDGTQGKVIQYDKPAYDAPYFSIGKPWDKNLVKGKPHMGYKGPYMAEYAADDVVFSKANTLNPSNNIGIPTKTITVDNPNLKFYKEDWLRGYKEIKPKQTGGQENLQYVSTPGSTYGNYYDPSTGEPLPQVYTKDVDIVADKELPFQNGKFAPFLASRGMVESDVLSDPIALAAAGAAAGLGLGAYGVSQVPKMFARNLASEATMGLTDLAQGALRTISKPSTSMDLEDMRRAYHNSTRFLMPEEIKYLRKHGIGSRLDYQKPESTTYFGPDEIDRFMEVYHVNRQLPPPPAQINLPGNIYSRPVVSNPRGGLFGMTPEQTNDIWANYIPMDWSKPKITNRSGLTKEEVLTKAPAKDKDVISKMSEDEFKTTVLKPTGEVVPYEFSKSALESENVIPMSPEEYTDVFNSRLDLLNDIIAEKNKSGVEYRVKGLTPEGRLKFTTPSISNSETSWGVRINPGQWRGEVEDVMNLDYYRNIPGISVSSSSSPVFADARPRRGSGTYDAINEYLKRLDLGRVKPGFNTQTDYSRGLWENAIKKGNAVGYYSDPYTIYGTMKSALPYAVPTAVGAAALQEQKAGGLISGKKIRVKLNK